MTKVVKLKKIAFTISQPKSVETFTLDLSASEIKNKQVRNMKNYLQVHLLQMTFALCPVLLTEETGGMPEIKKILFSIDFVNGYEILVEDPG